MNPLQGIIGKSMARGQVRYRRGDREAILYKGQAGFYLATNLSFDPLPYPTRKDAIERIEYLLTRA